jgi:hypothetical protein
VTNLSWQVGTQHTIATTSPQILTSTGGYAFSSWSDGGAISHSVTVSAIATAYTATFTQTASNVGSNVTYTLKATGYNKNTGVSTFNYTITNKSTTKSIAGPVQVVLTNPQAGGVNNTGTVQRYAYWTINSSIPPKTTVGLIIEIVTPPTTTRALSFYSGHF